MEKYNNWKLKFYTIWAGQAVSLITSAILQMAIIFYLTEKTGSAMVLSMASLVGFLPYAVFGPAIGVLVDRHDRKKIRVIWELPKANLINNGINFYDGDKLNHFRITSSKWIFHICSLLCNNGAFGSVLQRFANSSFSGEN